MITRASVTTVPVLYVAHPLSSSCARREGPADYKGAIEACNRRTSARATAISLSALALAQERARGRCARERSGSGAARELLSSDATRSGNYSLRGASCRVLRVPRARATETRLLLITGFSSQMSLRIPSSISTRFDPSQSRAASLALAALAPRLSVRSANALHYRVVSSRRRSRLISSGSRDPLPLPLPLFLSLKREA